MTFSERGQVHRALHDAKGRERPRVAFRAAGRAKRGGRSRPFDVLARAPGLRSCPRICLCSQGLQNRKQKTDQKTVRKTDFRTVFLHFQILVHQFATPSSFFLNDFLLPSVRTLGGCGFERGTKAWRDTEGG